MSQHVFPNRLLLHAGMAIAEGGEMPGLPTLKHAEDAAVLTREGGSDAGLRLAQRDSYLSCLQAQHFEQSADPIVIQVISEAGKHAS